MCVCKLEKHFCFCIKKEEPDLNLFQPVVLLNLAPAHLRDKGPDFQSVNLK